jgi:hypothetical protein
MNKFYRSINPELFCNYKPEITMLSLIERDNEIVGHRLYCGNSFFGYYWFN